MTKDGPIDWGSIVIYITHALWIQRMIATRSQVLILTWFDEFAWVHVIVALKCFFIHYFSPWVISQDGKLHVIINEALVSGVD